MINLADIHAVNPNYLTQAERGQRIREIAARTTGATEMVSTHRWQDAGLGQSPFHFVAMISMPSAETFGMNVDGYNNAMRDAQLQARAYGINGLGSCDACGTGIHNHCVIRDANGKHFKVGCDCVEKTGDSKLMTAAANAERLRQKAIRDAKREAAWEASRVARVAADDAERAKNGGLTDREVAEKNRQDELNRNRERFTAENGWLIDVLNQSGNGDFINSMIESLEVGPLSGLSDRCVSILRDIFAKAHGRRNSKAYNEAEELFYSHLPEIE